MNPRQAPVNGTGAGSGTGANNRNRSFRPQRPNNEKLIFVVLCIILALSITLAIYISTSATHTLAG